MSRPTRPSVEAATRFRRPVISSAFAAALGLAACEYPTEAPILESRWVVPAEETRFGVSQLLPGEVRLTPDSSAFLVDFDTVRFSESLSALCPACLLADGATVPKPPFLHSFGDAVDFPSRVSAVEVLDGQVALELVNGLNFDPLRPGAGLAGTLTVTLTDPSDGDVLGALLVDGAQTAFSPGDTLRPVIALAAATIEGSIAATVTIDSPAGDPITIDASLALEATAAPRNVRVASVRVDVSGESVTLDPVLLDVEGVGVDVADRVVEGAFIVDVTNPFGVGGTFDLTIDGPTIMPIQRSVAIGAEPSSTVTIDFSGAEIRSFLGQPGVILSGGAVVDPAAGIITLGPGQELVLEARLDLTLRIGGTVAP